MHYLSEGSRMELRAMLKQMGYSEKAIDEILKWYESSGLQAEGLGERSLRSGNISQQKHKR